MKGYMNSSNTSNALVDQTDQNFDIKIATMIKRENISL